MPQQRFFDGPPREAILQMPPCTHRTINDIDECLTCEICLTHLVCQERYCFVPAICPARLRTDKADQYFSPEMRKLIQKARKYYASIPLSRREELNRLKEQYQGAKTKT